MARTFCQASIDLTLTYDEDDAPSKDELREQMEKEMEKWLIKAGPIEQEIEIYVRGGKK